MHSRKIKLVIEYDGSGFSRMAGTGKCPFRSGRTGKGDCRNHGESTRVTGAGRTDTGVHAFVQVAHFDTQSKIPAEKFSAALNSILPPEVCILTSQQVPADFHARFTAVGKTYEYRILNRSIRSPLLARRAWHVREALDLEAMGLAAEKFVGEHDFSAFCSSGHSVQTFNRTLTASKWTRQGDCLVYRVSGNGFLYNMVRIMTGTMVEVGLKKRTAESMETLLNGKDRNKAGITAPPHGLYLLEVHYPP